MLLVCARSVSHWSRSPLTLHSQHFFFFEKDPLLNVFARPSQLARSWQCVGTYPCLRPACPTYSNVSEGCIEMQTFFTICFFHLQYFFLKFAFFHYCALHFFLFCFAFQAIIFPFEKWTWRFLSVGRFPTVIKVFANFQS